MRRIGQADILEAATAREGVVEAGASATSVSRAAGPLILSDVLLQGMRYLLLLYLGYRSLAYTGAFLLGSALGAVLGFALNAALQLGVKEEAAAPAGAAPGDLAPGTAGIIHGLARDLRRLAPVNPSVPRIVYLLIMLREERGGVGTTR
mgnify:CR=1 FL=1